MKENKSSDTNEERNITSTATTGTNVCVIEAEQDSAHSNSAAAQLMVNPINGFSGLSSPLLESIEFMRKDYQALFKDNFELGITMFANNVDSLLPDTTIASITSSVATALNSLEPFSAHCFGEKLIPAFESAINNRSFQNLQVNVNSLRACISSISNYLGELNVKWDMAYTIGDAIKRSFAAQDFAAIRIIPNYSKLDLPYGSKQVLKSLTKSSAKKLMQTDNMMFDPQTRKFFDKASPEVNLSADQIAVIESSLALFEGITFDELLSFESQLSEDSIFALEHPVGQRVFNIIKGWNKFVDFENITYYHARKKEKEQNPFVDSEMLKAPQNMPSHGRYNQIGKSCYYVAETKDGAIKEVRKHCGRSNPEIQIIGLKPIKHIKMIDLSGEASQKNQFIKHLRFTVENDAGKVVKEYLLPNFVASCCKRIGIEGIRYRSGGYNCCVLWKDDYFGFVEGSRDIV